MMKNKSDEKANTARAATRDAKHEAKEEKQQQKEQASSKTAEADGKAPAAAGIPDADAAEAERKKNALSTEVNFEADAGQGLEEADKDSFAIPFLVVLQGLSPVVVDSTVEGAKPGLFMNSVTQELYGTELYFVPCAFQRRFIRWQSRKNGGGFKGEFSPADAAAMRERGEVKELENRLYFPDAQGGINPELNDKLSDTRSHYGLILRTADDSFGMPAVMSLSSTGIKVSKNFLSRIDAIKFERADGSKYTPASYSHVYRLGVERKENNDGVWFIPTVTLVGKVKHQGLYAIAKGFHGNVTSGKAVAAHESMAKAGGEDATGGGKGGDAF